MAVSKMVKCSKCGRQIRYIKALSGNSIPVQSLPIGIAPAPDGALQGLTSSGQWLRGDYTQRSMVYIFLTHSKDCIRAERPVPEPEVLNGQVSIFELAGVRE